jgi:hypothetical protein
MSNNQRQKSKDRSELRAALAGFIDRPCRPTPQQAAAILDELCGKLGYCLAPTDYEAVQADPPTHPQAFAELVLQFEGGSVDQEGLAQVLELVLPAFEGITRQRDRRRS